MPTLLHPTRRTTAPGVRNVGMLLVVCAWAMASSLLAQTMMPIDEFQAPAMPAESGDVWISQEPAGSSVIDPELTLSDYYSGGPYCEPCEPWTSQILPDGLIYRSYMAGPREPKMQLVHLEEVSSSETLWDVILGGRRAIWRYGTTNELRPEGWELDIEGGAIIRLNLDNERDVDTSDFRFGVPLTYGVGRWQYKFGYYHLSSHLGDEWIVRTPDWERKNYVRDAIIFGASFNPTPAWRLYGETAYAFFTAGGAEPWEFQFGAEYSQPGVTGYHGTPFFATNGHLREELNFGGDYALQFGWLWRGDSGSQFRAGFQWLTGHSNYYQFYNESEEQYGLGIWYDF
ncbi:DUF1207 domain-containing protein [Aeoliella sp. ICT_H6.2]|uniref:DUF1207 domain-containing protein n=1 Tax=Aeoliella straminimaris TaxID=2954799 RepID=A0A9X2F7M0_9BACT|nr:DUF1207 domain-containing protein [Aeoliella straminimaris]